MKTKEDQEKWMKLQKDMRKCLPDTYICIIYIKNIFISIFLAFESVEPTGVPVSSNDLVGIDKKDEKQTDSNNTNDETTKK